MFKTGVITDEISQDLDTAIALAKEFSLDAVELRSVYDKSPFEFTDEDLLLFKQKLDDAGLKVSAISSPFYKCSIDNQEEIDANLKGLENCIKAAKMLDTKFIRGFAFWKKGELSDNIRRIKELYQKPIEMLMGSNIKLVLESDPSVNTTNAKELAEVIEAIDSEYVKGLWDPGNDLHAKPPETPYPDGYNYIKKHIAHVHLKDTTFDADQNPVGCCFGEGDVDYIGQLNALKADGYTGYIVMETHYRLKGVLSEETLARPGGSSFSADGYEPTKRCLAAMKKMLCEF